MKSLSLLLVSLSLLTSIFCSEPQLSKEVEDNPALHLNPQNVPFFSNRNPLEGLLEFNVFVPSVYKNETMNKKIASVIEKELSGLGSVIRLKSEDMRGFGSGVILNIQSARVSQWDGKELPILRTTLSIQAFVVMQKTNLICFPRVWAINDFVEAPLGAIAEDKCIESIQRAIADFSKNYKFSNPDQKKKPTFYFY